MLLLANIRRRRSAAAYALLGWLLVLFVGVAHACVSTQSSGNPPSGLTEVSVASHADCAHDDSDNDHKTCTMFCDAQTSAISKNKSLDTPAADHLILVALAYAIPLLPSVTVNTKVVENHSPSHDPNLSLRFTRLTL